MEGCSPLCLGTALCPSNLSQIEGPELRKTLVVHTTISLQVSPVLEFPGFPGRLYDGSVWLPWPGNAQHVQSQSYIRCSGGIKEAEKRV